MKNKYIYLLIVPIFLFFIGCDNNLDTMPEGQYTTTDQKKDVVASDPDKAAASVNSIFAQFSQYMPNYTTWGDVEQHNDFGYPAIMMFTESNGMDYVQEDNGYNWSSGGLDFSDRTFTSYECQIIWNNLYSIISSSNNVIETEYADPEDPTIKFYFGQALSVRAFGYWNLAQLFQFNYLGHQESPCVPLITPENKDEAIEKGLGRSTVQEVYNLILSDLDSSIEKLTDAQTAGVRRNDKRYVSLAVAYGLRARVHLTMHNYAEAAADAANAILNSEASPAAITDVNKPAFWTVDENNWMWGIKIAETDGVVTSGIVNWISHNGSLNWGYANYSKGKQINKKLFNSIQSTDVRKGWFIDENKTSPNLNDDYAWWVGVKNYVPYTNVKFAPYNEKVATDINANDVPLMRIEEMYLIKAEGEAMSGGNGQATLEDFVKTYRNPEYLFPASLSLQDEIWHQRRVELWGEGLAWFDIMRLNKGVDRRGGAYPNSTMVFNIPAGSDILIYRIPEAEIEANASLSHGDNNPSASAPNPVPDVE